MSYKQSSHWKTLSKQKWKFSSLSFHWCLHCELFYVKILNIFCNKNKENIGRHWPHSTVDFVLIFLFGWAWAIPGLARVLKFWNFSHLRNFIKCWVISCKLILVAWVPRPMNINESLFWTRLNSVWISHITHYAGFWRQFQNHEKFSSFLGTNFSFLPVLQKLQWYCKIWKLYVVTLKCQSDCRVLIRSHIDKSVNYIFLSYKVVL